MRKRAQSGPRTPKANFRKFVVSLQAAQPRQLRIEILILVEPLSNRAEKSECR
jgi:hypothetical protein